MSYTGSIRILECRSGLGGHFTLHLALHMNWTSFVRAHISVFLRNQLQFPSGPFLQGLRVRYLLTDYSIVLLLAGRSSQNLSFS